MGRLQGKKVLVTAAGQGIGRASALAMQAEGADVFATDLNEAALSELSAAGLRTFRLDVLDPDSIDAAVTTVGAPDVLFNCAGYVAGGSILDCDEAQWEFSFNLNVTAMYRMMRRFLPSMVKNGGGSIVNMASVASSVIAAPNRFVYGATKAAVIGMDYIEAARLRGESTWYLITKEVLPNITAPLAAEFGLRFCFVFLAISALSFLGLGIQPPTADWGSMVRENATLISFGEVTPLIPAGAIALLTVAVNFVVDWMLHISSGLKE